MMRATRLEKLVAAAALSFGGFAPAHGDDTPGAALYSQGVPGKIPSCTTCHGPRAEGVDPFPRLAGLPAQYLLDQLLAYGAGGRRNAVMQTIAAALDPQQAQAVADYVAGLSAPYPPSPEAGPAILAAGARLVTLGKWSAGVPACRDCHGPALRGGGPALPGLAGQPEAYLLGQLKAFRDGGRPGGPVGIMGRIAAGLDEAELQAAATYAASLREGEQTEIPRGERTAWEPRAQSPERFEPPPESALPSDPENAKAVLLGERIFADTPKYAADYAHNALSCRNCHTDLGRNAVSSPMWAAVPAYPKYRSKNRKVNSLAMRIMGCFRYSENGAQPPADSEEIVALMTYMNWLATGLPVGITPKASGYPDLPAPASEPDRGRGRAVYAADCAVCHGATGQGSEAAGARVIPPLWGPQSYNWGAGMHSVDNAAAFIYANMPYGAPGTLTVQQAWDVAAWIDSQPRPQDPRFTESVEKTRSLYHKRHAHEYYGATVDGMTLGAPGTLEAWLSRQAAAGGGD